VPQALVIEVPFEVLGVVIEQAQPEAAPAAKPSKPERNYEVWRDLLRATQGWIQWGTFGFAVLCIVIAAVESLFGR
jgi:hypothetical protein